MKSNSFTYISYTLKVSDQSLDKLALPPIQEINDWLLTLILCPTYREFHSSGLQTQRQSSTLF